MPGFSAFVRKPKNVVTLRNFCDQGGIAREAVPLALRLRMFVDVARARPRFAIQIPYSFTKQNNSELRVGKQI